MKTKREIVTRNVTKSTRKHYRGIVVKLKKYEFWQLIAVYLYGLIYWLIYRDIEEFRISEVLRNLIMFIV